MAMVGAERADEVCEIGKIGEAATADAANAARSDLFRDESVPQGRSAWRHQDAAGEYDKDLEEEDHFNVMEAAPHAQVLELVHARGQAKLAAVWEMGNHYGGGCWSVTTPEGAAEEEEQAPDGWHESAADRQCQDFLFDERMRGRYISAGARARPVCVDVAGLARPVRDLVSILCVCVSQCMCVFNRASEGK